MKRDKRLRQGLVRVLIERPADSQVSARLAGSILERWDELVNEGERLRLLVSEHHGVGQFDSVLIGDQCPVCKRSEGRSCQ